MIQYVRHRAALGAKFHRVDWPSLANLPASARACARRMSTLKGNAKCRKAIMKLCNMLSQRYAKHLEKSENMSLDDNNCRVLKRSSFKECPNLDSSKQWDDFDDKNIQRALEDILRLKQMAKWEASEKVGSISEECSNVKHLEIIYMFFMKPFIASGVRK